MSMEQSTNLICNILLLTSSGFLLLGAVIEGKRTGFHLEYDERQVADRATAYRAGFLVMVIYDVLYLLLRKAFGLVWCEELFGVGLGALAGGAVFLFVCIRRDAIFRVGKQTVWYKLLLTAIFMPCAYFTGTESISVIADGRFFRNGLVSNEALTVFAWLVIVPLCIIFFRAYMAETKRARKAG